MANVTPFTTAAFFCILIGWVIIIVAMAGSAWVQHDNLNAGLTFFCMCSENSCKCTDALEHSPSWIKATLAAVCLAFIGNFCAIITQSMYIVNIGKLGPLRICTLALLLFAIAWNLLAVIVYGAKYNDYAEFLTISADLRLGWTFGMPIVAVVLELFGIGFTALTKGE